VCRRAADVFGRIAWIVFCCMQKDTILFAIAFVGRSGSSYLQGLIDSHPDAQCVGELFWDESKSPEEHMKDKVHSASGVRASGFKLGNLHIIKFPEIREAMIRFNYRAIHLTRRNRVNQYISMSLAMRNNCWRSDMGDYTVHRFEVDVSHMEHYMNLMEEHDRIIEKFLDGIPVMKLAYEDLIQPGGADGVMAYLNLDKVPLASRFRKQRKEGGQREAIANYDDVIKHFERSPFAVHFSKE